VAAAASGADYGAFAEVGIADTLLGFDRQIFLQCLLLLVEAFGIDRPPAL
jgi:hypothetical protein